MSKRARPTGPQTDNDQILGGYVRNFRCTDVVGTRRRMRFGNHIKDLFARQHTAFQSLLATSPLNTGPGYRSQGTHPLNCRWVTGNSALWPRVLNCPVYVLRTFIPIGMQLDFPSKAQNINFSPTVMYRLQATQVNDNDDWTYSWAYVAVANNVDSDKHNCNLAFMQRGSVGYQSPKICCTSYDCKVLFTAPLSTSADVEVRVVKFSDDDAAPPDAGANLDLVAAIGGTGPVVPTVIRSNNSVFSDSLAQRMYAMHYNRWIHNRNTHPISRFVGPASISEAPPFKTLRRFSKTLCPRPMAAAQLSDTNPVQHMHRVIRRSTKFHRTGFPAFLDRAGATGPAQAIIGNGTGPGSAPAAPGYAQPHLECGIFPEPKDQEWIMISGWTRGAIPGESAIDLNQEISFDVRLDAHFMAAPTPWYNLIPGPGAGIESIPAGRPAPELDPIVEDTKAEVLAEIP